MSSEDYEPLKRLRQARRALKQNHGVRCPECVLHLPKANPSILLPGQVCHIHGWKNDAPRLSRDQVDETFESFGLYRDRSKEGK